MTTAKRGRGKKTLPERYYCAENPIKHIDYPVWTTDLRHADQYEGKEQAEWDISCMKPPKGYHFLTIMES